VLVLGRIVARGIEVGSGIDRYIAGVLEGQGWLDLLGLLWGGSEENEVDVLAARRLGGYWNPEGVLQALGAGFALAKLEEVGDLLGKRDRLIDMLGGDQAATFGLPALLESAQYAVTPFTAR